MTVGQLETIERIEGIDAIVPFKSDGRVAVVFNARRQVMILDALGRGRDEDAWFVFIFADVIVPDDADRQALLASLPKWRRCAS